MTIEQLIESARERVRLLDIAVEGTRPGQPEFDSLTGRYEEAKVFLDLIERMAD